MVRLHAVVSRLKYYTAERSIQTAKVVLTKQVLNGKANIIIPEHKLNPPLSYLFE